MRENCTSGTVRGAPGNGRPYREIALQKEVGQSVGFIFQIGHTLEDAVNQHRIGE